MRIGIVGLPNAGKSSLFNALTRAGAQAANYPFTTVEPNVAVVPVPDERLDKIAETIGATPRARDDRVPRHRGADPRRAQGRGLGNRFLANIRETDAILHVVRAHEDPTSFTPRAGSTPPPTSRRSTPSCCTPTSSRPSAGWSASRARPRPASAP